MVSVTAALYIIVFDDRAARILGVLKTVVVVECIFVEVILR